MPGGTPYRDPFNLIGRGTFAERPATGARDQVWFVTEGENQGKIYLGTGSGWALLPLQAHTHNDLYSLLAHLHDDRYSLLGHTHAFQDHNHDDRYPLILHAHASHSGILERLSFGFTMFDVDEIPSGSQVWHEYVTGKAITGTVLKANKVEGRLATGPTTEISLPVKVDDVLKATLTFGIGVKLASVTFDPEISFSDGTKLSLGGPDDLKNARGLQFHFCVYRIKE